MKSSHLKKFAALDACAAATALFALTGTLAVTATSVVPARADAAEVSHIVGMPVPRNASRVSDSSLAEGLGRLIAAAAKEFGLPPANGGTGIAEIYFWSGPAFKGDRAAFVRAQLEKALTEAGYTYREVAAGGAVSVPNAFDETYGIERLDLLPFGPLHVYFHATSVKSKKTVVGVWFHQENKKRFVLALGEAGFEGAPTDIIVPPVTDPAVWVVKDFTDATKGMPRPTPAFPKMAPKPGFLRGMAKDGAGKPLVGAKVVAWSSALGGFQTHSEAKTDARGAYQIPLPAGICSAGSADCRVTYNSKSLLLPLQVADGERDKFSSTNGHVENFVLRTSGVEGGAPLRVIFSNLPDTGILEVRLSPVGPLADGSKGKTLVFRRQVRTAVGEQMEFGGIPIGRYALTAQAFDGDETLPLRARRTFPVNGVEEAPAASLEVNFEGDLQQQTLPGQSNIRRFDVTLRP